MKKGWDIDQTHLTYNDVNNTLAIKTPTKLISIDQIAK
jgi:hypothetical protein